MEAFTIENFNKYTKNCGREYCSRFAVMKYTHKLKRVIYSCELEEFLYEEELTSFYPKGEILKETRFVSAASVNHRIESGKWV